MWAWWHSETGHARRRELAAALAWLGLASGHPHPQRDLSRELGAAAVSLAASVGITVAGAATLGAVAAATGGVLLWGALAACVIAASTWATEHIYRGIAGLSLRRRTWVGLVCAAYVSAALGASTAAALTPAWGVHLLVAALWFVASYIGWMTYVLERRETHHWRRAWAAMRAGRLPAVDAPIPAASHARPGAPPLPSPPVRHLPPPPAQGPVPPAPPPAWGSVPPAPPWRG